MAGNLALAISQWHIASLQPLSLKAVAPRGAWTTSTASHSAEEAGL